MKKKIILSFVCCFFDDLYSSDKVTQALELASFLPNKIEAKKKIDIKVDTTSKSDFDAINLNNGKFKKSARSTKNTLSLMQALELSALLPVRNKNLKKETGKVALRQAKAKNNTFPKKQSFQSMSDDQQEQFSRSDMVGMHRIQNNMRTVARSKEVSYGEQPARYDYARSSIVDRPYDVESYVDKPYDVESYALPEKKDNAFEQKIDNKMSEISYREEKKELVVKSKEKDVVSQKSSHVKSDNFLSTQVPVKHEHAQQKTLSVLPVEKTESEKNYLEKRAQRQEKNLHRVKAFSINSDAANSQDEAKDFLGQKLDENRNQVVVSPVHKIVHVLKQWWANMRSIFYA